MSTAPEAGVAACRPAAASAVSTDRPWGRIVMPVTADRSIGAAAATDPVSGNRRAIFARQPERRPTAASFHGMPRRVPESWR